MSEPLGQRGALEFRAISVTWQDGALTRLTLDRVDLAAGPGRFVAVVGPSGCGKSTLLRIAAGLVTPSAGSVAIDGVDVTSRPGQCAWLPQQDGLLPWRKVLGNAVLGAEIAGVPAAEAKARAIDLLERFGLADVADAWPHELSGGMRQRVAVLRAFLTPAPVLLLDEPFGALDALTRSAMQAWLQEVWMADASRSVLMVTHDVEEALFLADEVVIMGTAPGRILESMPVGFARPRPPDLIADVNFQEQRSQVLAALGV